MTFLDVLVDGEIVIEAMLVDREGKEVIYKGLNFSKRYQNIASNLIDRLPGMNYCILAMPNRKYLIIPVNDAKYLLLGLSLDVKAEDFIVQITRTLNNIEAITSKKQLA